jgi:TRAP-type C4-dicarboxylate transport system substrate-binding protein
MRRCAQRSGPDVTLSINRTLAVGIIVIAGGAGAALAGPPQKNGSVVTLTLAATESRGRPSTEIAETFASRVKALTKGTIIVKIAYDSGRTQGGETPLGVQEANLVAMVRTGKAQLAIVPTRAFDFQGISSFLALQAPFLTTTETGMDRATTGKIARQLQSGLPKLGLNGLGLVPEGLRRPFGFKHALVRPADFAGIRFIASRSKTLLPLLRLLGAKPVNLNGRAADQGVANGTVAGGDSTFALQANHALPQPGFTAGNIAFFPKVDALVGNDGALKRLTAAQLTMLRAAAATARTWALSHLTEAKGRVAYCNAGGTVVMAPASAIAALRAKAAPVLASIRSDSLTRTILRELAGSSSGPTAAPCVGAGRRAYVGPTVTAVIPLGVYRKTVTEQQLLAAGASATDAKTNGGTLTLTVTGDGYQTMHLDSPYPEKTITCATRKMYIVDPVTLHRAGRGLVDMELRGQGCSGDFGVAWKLAPGGIEFTGVSAPDPVLMSFWSGVFWRRVR